MANVWQKAFQRIFWKNRPDTSSPLGESKLLPMDASIDTIDDRVVTLQSTKAEQSDFLTALKNVQYNPSTGVFTITKFNDSSFTIDTDIEKIAINFDYDDDPTSAHYQQLIITLDDGTVKYVDLSALITEYEFGNTSTINFTVSGSTGIVTANIINGSITSDHLAPSVTAAINAAVNSAEAHAEDSEAWARGTKDGTPVPSTADQYQNNSKYYSELSDGSAEDSEAYAKGTRNGTAVSSDDPAYHNNAKYWSDQAVATLNNKVDKEAGKGLSSNDFTDVLKDKLDGIETGAEVNVQSDWSQSDNTADDYIKNKPTIPSVSWTQIQASGTKIAEIDINGTSQDVYAPTGSGGNPTASDVSYDNTETEIPETNVQGAIDLAFATIDNQNDVLEGLVNPTFTEAQTRTNVASGDSYQTLWGKVKKFFTDLKDLAFIAKDGTSSTKYLRGDGTWQTFPTIPAEQIQSDWNQTTTTAKDYIKNKPSLGTAAATNSIDYIKQYGWAENNVSMATLNNGTYQTNPNQMISEVATLVSDYGFSSYGTFRKSSNAAYPIYEYFDVFGNLAIRNIKQNIWVIYYSSSKFPSEITFISKYPNGGNDVTKCPVFIQGADSNKRPAIGFYNPSAAYSCMLYMAPDGSLYARWNDGTEKKIVGH